MKTIEPTHKEIMDYLDCCWYGKYHKGQCQCNSKCQFKDCYEQAKTKLTRTELTEEEIKAKQEQNQKTMDEIKKALDGLWGE